MSIVSAWEPLLVAPMDKQLCYELIFRLCLLACIMADISIEAKGFLYREKYFFFIAKRGLDEIYKK